MYTIRPAYGDWSMKQRPRRERLGELKAKLRLLERPQPPVRGPSICSTGLEALDRMFPQGGLAQGTLIEWLSKGAGSGGATLALLLARRLQKSGGLLVVIDAERAFYPPGVQALGMPLDETMVIQTSTLWELYWAWEQVLRSTAVAAAVGWLDKLPDRVFRRLQLAAEAGGTAGFLLRPEDCRVEPSWAEARFLVEALPSEACGGSRFDRRLRVELLRCRGGGNGDRVELEISDEAGNVSVVPLVAHSASQAGAARA
jgi:hypothetical protein